MSVARIKIALMLLGLRAGTRRSPKQLKEPYCTQILELIVEVGEVGMGLPIIVPLITMVKVPVQKTSRLLQHLQLGRNARPADGIGILGITHVMPTPLLRHPAAIITTT